VSEFESEMKAREREWMDATEAHDAPALAAILDEEFTTTLSSGQRIDKATWLDHARDRVAAGSYEQTDFRISRYGDVAVVQFRLQVPAGREGRAYLLTHVWVLRDGRWRAVTRHSSQAAS